MAKYKKRWVNIPGKGRIRLSSKQIDQHLAKVKVFDTWFIFNINNGYVIAQGVTWTDVIKQLKTL